MSLSRKSVPWIREKTKANADFHVCVESVSPTSAQSRQFAMRLIPAIRPTFHEPSLNGENIPAEHLALLGATSNFIPTLKGGRLVTIANRTDPA